MGTGPESGTRPRLTASVTNLGNTHQDGHRNGVMIKAETDISDSKAVTNLGDSHQDGHRAGVATKAETDSGDSEEVPWPDLYADHRGPTQDSLHDLDIIDGLTRDPEEEIVKDKGPGNYAARHAKRSKGLDEEEKELLKVNNGEDIQAMRKFIADLPPVRSQEELLGKEERIVILERGVQEEMNSRAERSAIRGGQYKKDGVHEEGDTYPLANPGLAEAPDIDHSTVVPRTGADRSATQPLIDTNPLYMQHQYKDEESRHIDKTRHNGAGAKTEAGTNTGDYIHGDSHQDGHRSRDKTKAEINIGNTHHDGYRAGARTKAETIIGDPKAMTNLGDSHQEGHRAGAKDKANDLVIAKRKTTKHDSARDPKP